MRPPATPPDIERLLKATPPDRLGMALAFNVWPTEKYLHWDDLLHHQPPANLSHEEWWLALKIGRKALYRQIPLTDRKGETFRYFITDPMLSILHEVDMRAGGSVSTSDQVTNPETRNQYLVSSLMDEAITSSQLEGAATTREVARQMLRSNRPPRDTSERMILNNYLTMRQLAEWKNEPLSQELVFRIHRLITEKTLDDETAAGRFRRMDETIYVEDDLGEIFHVPPPAAQLPTRMSLMCAFANAPDDGKRFIHPVVRAIQLHFWLAYDHPFKDGNGRTARALFYWLMLRRGFWLFEFVSISQFLVRAQTPYARAFLHTETDENDLNYFILHQLQIIKKGVDALQTYIERKTSELKSVSNALRLVEHLNHRQEAILNRAFRHPGTIFTVESHKASHDIAYDTARLDLMGLDKHGFLTKRKRGKGYVFEAAPDLGLKFGSFSK